MIRLFTTIYHEKNKLRKNELFEAIAKNIKVSAIGEIYLLNELEDIAELVHPKTKVIDIIHRPKYSDYFKIINEIAQEGDISILANTDIYFDESIGALEYTLTRENCFALSRWDTINSKQILFNRNDSQDTWIFRGKIKENINGDFYLGVPRCDNRILFELHQAGYDVSNPAFSIRSYHLHTGIREEYTENNQDSFIPPPYKYLFPSNVYNLPRVLFFNLTHTAKLVGYCYDRKKINRWLLVKVARKLLQLFLKYEMPLIGYPK